MHTFSLTVNRMVMFLCMSADKEQSGRDIFVTYFVPDDLGGYQKEEKSYYIDSVEIIKHISRLTVKKIGRRRKTFLFHDLKT